MNIGDAETLRRAADTMGAEIDRFLVETMVSGAVAELLVGVVRDPQFGLSLTIGAGGTLVELAADTHTLLFPVSEKSIAEALERLTVSTLLDGYRGRPRGDRRAAVDAILALAECATDVTGLEELEVNPLLVLPEGQGVAAVDAMMRVRSEQYE